MKKTLRHKILGVLLALVVLFPLALQASEVFEGHEHQVCTAKDVKHFHADELDFCLCCTPVELITLPPNFDNYSLDQIQYLDSCETITQLTSLDFFQLKSPRAPPILS